MDKFSGGAFGELRRSLSDDAVVVVPIPPLYLFFLEMEKRKGSPLTEEEVLDALEVAPAITMLAADRDQLDEKRGFPDLDPDNVWSDWQEFRAALDEEDD